MWPRKSAGFDSRVKALPYSDVIFASLFLLASALPATSWRIGDAQEVDEGVYATLLHRKDGWTVWQFEKEDEINCHAAKGQAGAFIRPIGVAENLWGPKPFLQVSMFGWSTTPRAEIWSLVGTWGASSSKFRKPGDKFWKEADQLGAGLEGVIEVNVVSWQYPAILVGRSEDHGYINLTGIDAARVAIEPCLAAGKVRNNERTEKIYRDLEARGVRVRP